MTAAVVVAAETVLVGPVTRSPRRDTIHRVHGNAAGAAGIVGVSPGAGPLGVAGGILADHEGVAGAIGDRIEGVFLAGCATVPAAARSVAAPENAIAVVEALLVGRVGQQTRLINAPRPVGSTHALVVRNGNSRAAHVGAIGKAHRAIIRIARADRKTTRLNSSHV